MKHSVLGILGAARTRLRLPTFERGHLDRADSRTMSRIAVCAGRGAVGASPGLQLLIQCCRRLGYPTSSNERIAGRARRGRARCHLQLSRATDGRDRSPDCATDRAPPVLMHLPHLFCWLKGLAVPISIRRVSPRMETSRRPSTKTGKYDQDIRLYWRLSLSFA